MCKLNQSDHFILKQLDQMHARQRTYPMHNLRIQLHLLMSVASLDIRQNYIERRKVKRTAKLIKSCAGPIFSCFRME